MSSTQAASTRFELAPRHAAVVAGLVYLLNTTPLAEYLYSRIVVPGNIEQTTINLSAHKFVAAGAFFAYVLNLVGDVVMAWAIYFMLAPVNRSLSLLAAWFQLMYAAVALSVTMPLLTAWNLVNESDFRTLFDDAQIRSQVSLLLHSFRDSWSMSLSIFGIHLVLVGALILRSSYVPRVIGILLIINGLGWLVGTVGPYVFPDADLGYVSISYLGEAVFMLWLLIKGRKIAPSAATRELALSAA